MFTSDKEPTLEGGHFVNIMHSTFHMTFCLSNSIFPYLAAGFIFISHFDVLHIFLNFLQLLLWYLCLPHTVTPRPYLIIIASKTIFYLFCVFSFSLFILLPFYTVSNDQLLQKKMCFIYRAQLMEVLLYLLAGSYVSLFPSALCCKHDCVPVL